MDNVYVYKDASGEYRWHRKAENGEIVSESGEGYVKIAHCLEMASSLNPGCSFKLVSEDDNDE
jgi:uncharacterized protein YegP (UPF0339 family)